NLDNPASAPDIRAAHETVAGDKTSSTPSAGQPGPGPSQSCPGHPLPSAPGAATIATYAYRPRSLVDQTHWPGWRSPSSVQPRAVSADHQYSRAPVRRSL